MVLCCVCKITFLRRQTATTDSTCSQSFLQWFLPTAYVVRREGSVLTRVCPAVCPHLGGGGYPSQIQLGGISSGTPCWTWPGGVPLPGQLPPPQVTPLPHPCQTWPGGYPTSGNPCQTWLGGYPCRRAYPTSGNRWST